MGLIVAGATSAGGLTALAVKLFRKKNKSKEIPYSHSIKRRDKNESSNQDVSQNSR
jgi:hypothetical protein